MIKADNGEWRHASEVMFQLRKSYRLFGLLFFFPFSTDELCYGACALKRHSHLSFLVLIFFLVIFRVSSPEVDLSGTKNLYI